MMGVIYLGFQMTMNVDDAKPLRHNDEDCQSQIVKLLVTLPLVF